jgi:glutamine synthetase
MDRQQEFVLRTIEERDIRFVRLWFTDVLGTLKSVAVAPAELEGAFAEGIGFDGSAIEGFARVYEADMLAKPDPATFQVLPWRGESPGTARMFCDLQMPDGSPSFADPSKPIPSANAPSSSAGATATDFRNPSTSVNHSRTKRMSRSSIVRRTNSCCRSM